MPPQKPRWMLWLQKSWQNKALWKNTQDPLPTARQGIFLLNHVEEFDILKSRSLWMERNIMFVKIKADIRHWLRELDKKYFCVMLGFAVMVYFPLISLKLTNTVDGLWTTAEYMAGAWELSNGRWFWLVTSFLRFSLQLEPINAVVCLVLVSLGVTRLHMLFKPAWMRTSCIDWLAGLCYVSNVVAGELVAEGYYDLPEKLPVMLVGRPSASPLFRTHIIYWDANDYAQVGLFEKENAATMRYSWNAVFRDLTPMQLELCSDEVYDELIRTEEIKRMPTFPEKGSMQEMDGVYVIKISEDYLIDE